MLITVSWDDDAKTRLLVQFGEFWTWGDVEEVLKAGGKLLDEDTRGTRIDVIVDGSNTMTLMKSDTHERVGEVLARVHGHPRVNRVVIVGSGAITNSFLSLFLRISTRGVSTGGYEFFSTVAAARDYLSEPDTD